MMQQFALETNPSPPLGPHLNSPSVPFGINAEGASDFFNFSPIFAPRSNVLLSAYNSILDPSPPTIQSYFLPDNHSGNNSVSRISVALEETSSDFVECPFVAVDEFFDDFYFAQEDNSETSEPYTSPSYCNSDHSYNSPQSVSPHASSAPIMIDNQSPSYHHADVIIVEGRDEDLELSNIIEKATSVSTCTSGDEDPFPFVFGGTCSGKNEQEIYEEIYRECEPKYWNLDGSESDVRSSDSVISVDIGNDDAYDASSETGCNRIQNRHHFGAGFSSTDSDPDGFNGGGINSHTRKKTQNRHAALRYRSKKRGERVVLGAERQRLEMENGRLKALVQDRQMEIEYLRKFMHEIRQKIYGGDGNVADELDL